MRSRKGVIFVSLVSILAGSCAAGRYGPSASSRMKPAPRTLKKLTVAERDAILVRAQVWSPVATQSLDLLVGPQGPGAFKPQSETTCRFVYPSSPLTGLTPKFRCAMTAKDEVKVKFGPHNGEVYGVVAASRLAWALGFASDTWYPARVSCLDCPEDPWKASGVEWYKGWPQFVAARKFDPSAIEREFPGDDVETPDFSGWSWPELDRVDSQKGGAPRAQVDALKLLAVFLQHNDTKPVQQRLVCPPGELVRGDHGNETCRSARLVLKDVGATFGEGSFWRVDKVNLERWRDAPVWRDAESCIGHLPRYLNGSLEHPAIGEAGRQFLAERLSLLSDKQIRDLFTAARVEQRGDVFHPQPGVSRPPTVDDWVRVFKDKRAQIVNHHCSAG